MVGDWERRTVSWPPRWLVLRSAMPVSACHRSWWRAANSIRRVGLLVEQGGGQRDELGDLVAFGVLGAHAVLDDPGAGPDPDPDPYRLPVGFAGGLEFGQVGATGQHVAYGQGEGGRHPPVQGRRRWPRSRPTVCGRRSCGRRTPASAGRAHPATRWTGSVPRWRTGRGRRLAGRGFSPRPGPAPAAARTGSARRNRWIRS